MCKLTFMCPKKQLFPASSAAGLRISRRIRLHFSLQFPKNMRDAANLFHGISCSDAHTFDPKRLCGATSPLIQFGAFVPLQCTSGRFISHLLPAFITNNQISSLYFRFFYGRSSRAFKLSTKKRQSIPPFWSQLLNDPHDISASNSPKQQRPDGVVVQCTVDSSANRIVQHRETTYTELHFHAARWQLLIGEARFIIVRIFVKC